MAYPRPAHAARWNRSMHGAYHYTLHYGTTHLILRQPPHPPSSILRTALRQHTSSPAGRPIPAAKSYLHSHHCIITSSSKNRNKLRIATNHNHNKLIIGLSLRVLQLTATGPHSYTGTLLMPRSPLTTQQCNALYQQYGVLMPSSTMH